MTETPIQLLLEAAQCLWEAYLDREGQMPSLDAYRERFGTVELRFALRDEAILGACSLGITTARNHGYHDCYDWEFCPWFLANCVRVGGAKITLRPDWEARCKALGKEAGQ